MSSFASNSKQSIGYNNATKLENTLQGTVWKAKQPSTNKDIVIKITKKDLHKKSAAVQNGRLCAIEENIKSETVILRHLTSNPKCPKSIVKFIDFFKTDKDYRLIMEDGGEPLFEFVQTVHEHIKKDEIEISDWHNLVKIMFKQMIEAIEYTHSQNVCHFDISLENILLNGIDLFYGPDDNIYFLRNGSIQIKLCDYGLAHYFGNYSDFLSNKYCGKVIYRSPEIVDRKKLFNAKSNDVFSLGVALFVMLFGIHPWKNASYKYDKACKMIMDGKLEKLLKIYKREKYGNNEIIELLSMIFQFEDKRATIEDIKNCSWLNDEN